MNVVDSTGWLEYFADGPNAAFFAGPIEDVARLWVPSISVFEVFKCVLQQRGEGPALHAIAVMRLGAVIDLDDTLAIASAKVSVDHRIPMADAIILAAARSKNAVLWTQDRDFEGLDGVRFIPKLAAY